MKIKLSIASVIIVLIGFLFLKETAPYSYQKVKLLVSQKYMEILYKSRSQALEAGILKDEFQKYVPGKLIVDGEEFLIKVKLKGTLSEHWAEKERLSYRIVLLEKGKFVNGMKIFSIQSQIQRGSYIDQLYHSFLQASGVLNLQLTLIDFDLNGKTYTDYTIEEFFDTQLLVRQNRPPGAIIKFEYSQYWNNVDWNSKYSWSTVRTTYNKTYKNAPLKSYKLRSGNYPQWKEHSKKGIELLRKFRSEELKTKDVFDIELLAKYFAVNSIFGNQHSALLTNLRFYYNPITKRLEPIGYDLERIHKLINAKDNDENYLPNNNHPDNPLFTRQVFRDSTINLLYKAQLQVIALSVDSIIKLNQPNFDRIKSRYLNVEDERSYLIENAVFIQSSAN
jgi:hypothetical protein